jgi:K+ transporter
LLSPPQALFGTSLTMADGILTAAVSVTSAVGGIGESIAMSGFARLLNYAHSRCQALGVE